MLSARPPNGRLARSQGSRDRNHWSCVVLVQLCRDQPAGLGPAFLRRHLIDRLAVMDDLVRAMNAAGSPENARALARYFKAAPGEYGEGDIFLGLKLGELRQLAKPYLNSAFDPDQWLPMLHSPIHEHRLITLVVMTERAKKIVRRGDGNEFRLIYDTYLYNTHRVNNWDLVDLSCGPIVGGYLLDRDRSPLYELARSDLLWDRGVAMVGCQTFSRGREPSTL